MIVGGFWNNGPSFHGENWCGSGSSVCVRVFSSTWACEYLSISEGVLQKRLSYNWFHTKFLSSLFFNIYVDFAIPLFLYSFIWTFYMWNFRSLPDLSLLKETSLRGFTFPSSNSEISLSSSSEGELLVVIKLIMIRNLQHISISNIRNCLWNHSLLSSFLQVNADQEIFFVSSLSRKDIYRCVCVFVYLCKCI